MNRGFGPTGPLLKGQPQKERSYAGELFTGAFSVFRNPTAHREVKFDDPHESSTRSVSPISCCAWSIGCKPITHGSGAPRGRHLDLAQQRAGDGFVK